MNTFWRSFGLAASYAGAVVSPFLGFAFVAAHLSFTSEAAQAASVYMSWMAVPLFIGSVSGIVSCSSPSPVVQQAPDAPMSRLAVFSLSSSCLGIVTAGVGAIFGFVTGIIALRQIASGGELRGQELAMGAIGVALVVLGLASSVFFLGP